MKKIRLKKAWMGHAAGTILEIDAETYGQVKGLEGVAEDYVEAPAAPETKTATLDEATKKSFMDEVATRTEKAVQDQLKAMAGDSKMIHISVRDRADDDPLEGFLPGNQKSLKDLEPGEVHYAFGQFARQVKMASNGQVPDTLRKAQEKSHNLIRKAAGDGMVVNSDEDGGFLIFSAASQMISRASLETAIVRPRANKITMATQLLQVPYLRDDDHSSGLVYQGIKVFFDDENEASTESKVKMGKMEFKLKKMTCLGYASEEWVKWSPVSLGSWLIPKFGEAISFKEDLTFLAGPGGGQPKGITNASCRIAIAKEDGQDAATFVLENSTAMFARLLVRKQGSVAWLMNRSTFPQLPLFNIQVGTGGAPVFTNNVGEAPGQKLWGIPIIWTEKVPKLGVANSVMLVDFSDYTIADDQTGPAISQSMHFKFDLGQNAFRIVKYIDGQNETIKPFQGRYGDTLSPVIALPA